MDQSISKNNLRWIPYNEFENIGYLNKRGFSTTYIATHRNTEIVLKYFNCLNADEIFGEFLSKRKIIKKSDEIINIYGFTKNPDTLDYMLIMEYANNGDLIHYGFHDGNILCVKRETTYDIYISDYLKPYQFTKFKGVIPFMAPEVLRDLMKRCWEDDLLKRPPISEVLDIIEKLVILPDSSMKLKDIDKKLKSDIMEFINAPSGYNNIITKTHPQAFTQVAYLTLLVKN
ncbi:kinase-like domain-containing protein [Rhizophagus clarus]|uniref:Kinase-like domain-containing protein n=1 Tax=Rhizophagus clarus TaxID=94130 RepID=A0A8H3L5W3_9GLOM|nr:kinase-like domain-containing protein [Rhizophagus clarus]